MDRCWAVSWRGIVPCWICWVLVGSGSFAPPSRPLHAPFAPPSRPLRASFAPPSRFFRALLTPPRASRALPSHFLRAPFAPALPSKTHAYTCRAARTTLGYSAKPKMFPHTAMLACITHASCYGAAVNKRPGQIFRIVRLSARIHRHSARFDAAARVQHFGFNRDCSSKFFRGVAKKIQDGIAATAPEASCAKDSLRPNSGNCRCG